ncbi:MAG: hypothetical protein II739_08555 [Clostridia bacterium]|nr:hypothetical protein [Clostridia bacterium]
MKTIKRIASLVFVLLLMLSLCAGVFAEDPASGGSTTTTSSGYVVRLYPGNSDVGTLASGDAVMTQQVASGADVTFTLNQVKIEDDRFYAKGFREAGHDNNPVFTFGTSVTITRDTDFVIAYGMKSTAVKYTVYYKHATTGADLIAPQTYYGNAGDKPVVAFQYIENFMPQAYNLTKTLSDDETQNILTFRYEPIPEVPVQQNQVVPANNNANANANAGANANANANAGANANANANAGDNANANANAGTNANTNANAGTNAGTGENANAGTNAGTGENAGGAGTEPTTPTQPEEIIDLDVPQAGPGQQQQGQSDNGPFGGPSKAIYLASGLVILGLLGIPLVFFLRRRKEKKEEAQEK